jgi:D-alanyl-D-alanine carboxypeptidase/D-alanyl-D-alanine-endopeptidase (penicillin-binding protein 4)
MRTMPITTTHHLRRRVRALRRARLSLFAVLAALFLISAGAMADLRADVQQAINSARLKGATIGISIRDAETNAELVDVGGDQLLIPASNMKLLTTGAALHVLGASFEFKTRLVRDGDRLIVIGDGDPGFGDPELLAIMALPSTAPADGAPPRPGIDVETFLNLWVRPVVEKGIKSVSEIVVDDRVFDRQFVHPDWPADQLNLHYRAQASGLTFHLNVLQFFPKPRKGERPIIGDSRPLAPWLQVLNKGTSRTGSDDKNEAWIARQPGTNELTLYGNVRFAYKEPLVRVTVHDMPQFFARIMSDRLTSAGVTVKAFRAAAPGDPPTSQWAAGETIGPVIYTPISTAVTRCNRDSENLYAECLLKRIGYASTRQPGSWTNGSAIIRHVVHERLSDPTLASKVIVKDGSGLSRENKVAPETFTAWLSSFHRDSALSAIFVDSLAVGGESGTLAKRFQQRDLRGAIVHGKSGYIDGVSCLTGYVSTPDGRRRSFSVMVNNLKDGTVGEAKKLQEAVVVAIAKDMAVAPTTVQVGGG